MPSRSFRGARRPRRKTFWTAEWQTWNLLSAGGNAQVDVFDANVAETSGINRDVTLERIRGVLLVDGDFTGTVASQNYLIAASIYVEDSQLGAITEAQLGRDSVIWADLMGESVDRLQDSAAGTEEQARALMTHQWQKSVIDIKARRRMGDTKRIVFSILSSSSPTTVVDVRYSLLLRMLFSQG